MSNIKFNMNPMNNICRKTNGWNNVGNYGVILCVILNGKLCGCVCIITLSIGKVCVRLLENLNEISTWVMLFCSVSYLLRWVLLRNRQKHIWFITSLQHQGLKHKRLLQHRKPWPSSAVCHAQHIEPAWSAVKHNCEAANNRLTHHTSLESDEKTQCAEEQKVPGLVCITSYTTRHKTSYWVGLGDNVLILLVKLYNKRVYKWFISR